MVKLVSVIGFLSISTKNNSTRHDGGDFVSLSTDWLIYNKLNKICKNFCKLINPNPYHYPPCSFLTHRKITKTFVKKKPAAEEA